MVLDEILQEAKNAGVEKVLAVGMSYLSQERIIEISESYEMILKDSCMKENNKLR